MGTDRPEESQAWGPVGIDIAGMIMGRGTDRGIAFAGKRFGSDLAGPVPEKFRRFAAQRTIAGVGELTAGGPFAALIDHAAHRARIAGMADPVEDHLSDGALTGIGFQPRLIIDRLGQAIEGPAVVGCRAAKGSRLDAMGRHRQITGTHVRQGAGRSRSRISERVDAKAAIIFRYCIIGIDEIKGRPGEIFFGPLDRLQARVARIDLLGINARWRHGRRYQDQADQEKCHHNLFAACHLGEGEALMPRRGGRIFRFWLLICRIPAHGFCTRHRLRHAAKTKVRQMTAQRRDIGWRDAHWFSKYLIGPKWAKQARYSRFAKALREAKQRCSMMGRGFATG